MDDRTGRRSTRSFAAGVPRDANPYPTLVDIGLVVLAIASLIGASVFAALLAVALVVAGTPTARGAPVDEAVLGETPAATVTPDQTAPARRAAPTPAVEESPEILYLPDDGGRLVPVPGFRYRDFLELLRLRDGLPGVPRPPSVVVDRLVVDIRPGEGPDAGSCAVVATFDLRQMENGTVVVPLGLEGLILSAAPESNGPGRFVLEGLRGDEAAGGGRGYRGWLSGARDDRLTVTLVGRVPIEAETGRLVFGVDLPAATTSRCLIHSALDEPMVTLDPAGIPPRVEREEGGGSLVVCEGLGGGRTTFEIGPRGSAAPAGNTLPQVTAESLVKIDGRVATIDASLRIDGLAADVRTVRIGLPARSSLVGVREPSVLVSPAASPADSPDIAFVEVRPGRRPDGTAMIDLECECPVDGSGSNPFDPLGFVVDGVPGWRQRGRAALVVAGEWQLDWGDPAPNRRTDPAPSARQPGFVAAFSYDSQPARLPMRVRPRGSRVVIEPEYRYSIGSTRLTLEAKLRVSVRGAPVTRVALELEGWTIDEVGPASLVDGASVITRDGEVSIPFLQPLAGDAVVEVRAARTIDRGSDRLDWVLPTPRADLVGPATVAISADDDIEILPDGERIRGLVRQVVPSSRRADGDRVGLVYRLEGDRGEFGATRRTLSRSVEAVVDARIAVGEEETAVEETLRIDVAHVPMESIDLLLPPSFATDGSIDILQGGQRLSPFELPTSDAGGDASGGRVVRSLLSTPLLGSGEIQIRWSVPTPAGPFDGASFPLPLVLPRGARVAQQSVQIVGAEAIAVDVRGDAWKRDAAAASAATPRRWIATRPQESIPLTLSAARGGAGETVVEAAWLETRLLPDRREDAFTYAVSTTARRLTMVLPPFCRPAVSGGEAGVVLDLRVDGIPAKAAVDVDGTLDIEMPRPGGGETRTAVLVRLTASRQPRRGWDARTVAAAGGFVGPLTLEAPGFPEGTLQRRFYWEVQLDDQEHVVAAPTAWTPQQRWEWGTLGLHRVPVVTRGVLSDWITAAARLATPRAAADPARRGAALAAIDPLAVGTRTLFAGTGNPGTGRVWVVPTWLAVLGVSGPILAVGLAMVYRPTWRRAPAVFAILLPALVAAVVFPDVAPLVIQSAIPGAVLALVAAALRRAAEGPREPVFPAEVLIAGGSSTRIASPPSLIVNVDGRSERHPEATGRKVS